MSNSPLAQTKPLTINPLRALSLGAATSPSLESKPNESFKQIYQNELTTKNQALIDKQRASKISPKSPPPQTKPEANTPRFENKSNSLKASEELPTNHTDKLNEAASEDDSQAKDADSVNNAALLQFVDQINALTLQSQTQVENEATEESSLPNIRTNSTSNEVAQNQVLLSSADGTLRGLRAANAQNARIEFQTDWASAKIDSEENSTQSLHSDAQLPSVSSDLKRLVTDTSLASTTSINKDDPTARADEHLLNSINLSSLSNQSEREQIAKNELDTPTQSISELHKQNPHPLTPNKAKVMSDFTQQNPQEYAETQIVPNKAERTTSLTQMRQEQGSELAISETKSFSTQVNKQIETLANTTAITQETPKIQDIKPAIPMTTDHLTPRVGSKAWDQALSQKVIWMVAGEESSAQLSLNPPDLGPLQIVLSVSDQQIDASFISAHLDVREAIEAAAPKLKEMMDSAGLSLSGFSVSAEAQASQNPFSQNSRARSHIEGGIQSDKQDSVSERLSASNPLNKLTTGNGLVDTFV